MVCCNWGQQEMGLLSEPPEAVVLLAVLLCPIPKLVPF
jgi:hypothetical protein